MTDIIISVLTSVVSILFVAILLKYDALQATKDWKAIFPKNTKQLIFGLGMIVSIGLVTFSMLYLYKEYSWIFYMKRIIICAVLWYFSFVDFRKHIIPNKVLLCLLILRIVILIAEIVLERDTIRQEIVSDLIASAGVVVFFVIIRLLIKNGIGFGDIKLFAIIGLFMGVRSVLTVVFLSFFVSFFASLYSLISKKKTKKDQMAFAPFILVGTMLSIVLFGA